MTAAAAAHDWTLAIDFGTSNTAAAHTNPVHGTVEAVSLAHDSTTMPSAVYIQDPSTILTGNAALDAAQADPVGYVASPKRVIPQGNFQVRGEDVPASAPVAAVIRAVIERASRAHEATPPARVVLTHPEAWSDKEIGTLLNAAQEAGIALSRIQTISEPVAAAHYYAASGAVDAGDTIAVFDFGGGTLDVAVLRAAEDGSFRVVAAEGDSALGGRSFDYALRRWVERQLEDEYPDLYEHVRTAPVAEQHQLDTSVRRAKELLSDASSATITVSGGGEQARLLITRAEFESLIEPQLERAAAVTREALEAAGVHEAQELKALYLTGGTTRVPLVQEVLKDLGPVSTLDDPKTVTAQGALVALAEPAEPAAPAAEEPVSEDPAQRSGTVAVRGPRNVDALPAPRRASRAKSVIAGLLIAGISGAGAWFVGGPGSSENPTPAVSVQGEGKVVDVDSVESLRELLPVAIQSELTSCGSGGSGRTGALTVRCQVNKSSPDMQYFKAPQGDWDTITLTFTMNENEARSQRAYIRDGRQTSGARQAAGPINDAAGNRIAVATIAPSSTDVQLEFAATDIPLTVTSRDFATPEQALEWVRDKGLIVDGA